MASPGHAQQVALRHYTVADGLSHHTITRVFQDSRGYVWFTTADGLSRFDSHSFATYGIDDGLPRGALTAIGETGGRLWVATRSGSVVLVNDTAGGDRFVPGRNAVGGPVALMPPPVTGVPAFLSSMRRAFEHRRSGSAPLVLRGTSAVVTDLLQDRSGTIWIGTSGSGVFTVPREPVVSYTSADELPDAHVLRVLESRDGRIYAVTRRGGVAELKEEGVEALAGSLFAPFHTLRGRIVQDQNGAWWLWTDDGLFGTPGPALSFTLAQPVKESRPVPPELVGASLVDSQGRSWTGLRGGGVARCDAAAGVKCVQYTKAEGIGHLVTSIAEDAFGRVYVGTTKGLFRFDAAGSTFAAIPSGVRLAGSSITHCMRDSRGRMWIATTTGVSVIVPRAPGATPAPQAYVVAVSANGRRIAVPPRGAVALPDVAVGARGDTVRIDYAAPGSAGDGTLRFQRRLNGVDTGWSAAATAPTVTYSRLPPGSHRFEVRAVASDGTTGPPAILALHVLAPPWTRWCWPVTAGAALLLARRLRRQAQRAYRRRNLAGMTLRVLGGMEQESEHGRR